MLSLVANSMSPSKENMVRGIEGLSDSIVLTLKLGVVQRNGLRIMRDKVQYHFDRVMTFVVYWSYPEYLLPALFIVPNLLEVISLVEIGGS